MRRILSALIGRIDVLSEQIDIHLVFSGLADILLADAKDLPPAPTDMEEQNPLTLSVPAQLKRAGMGVKRVVEGNDPDGQKTKPDLSLNQLITKAYTLQEKLLQIGSGSIAGLARTEGLTASYVTRVIRPAFLSPDITRATLDGRHPPDLTAARLTRLSRLPLDWKEQKTVLGFA